MEDSVHKLYGNRLRVRACGICILEEKILLINHTSISEGDFWAPPGGGVSFGESAENSLIREFKEETGLTVSVDRFLFACEFIKHPLHAIELFFEVSVTEGTLTKGFDPEMGSKTQIIQEVRFVSEGEIKTMKPNALHGIFQLTSKPSKILDLSGYFKL